VARIAAPPPEEWQLVKFTLLSVPATLLSMCTAPPIALLTDAAQDTKVV
jgi:hypothetical protein